jgi:hypothetical protein
VIKSLATKFRPGDIVFWSIDRTAGEAMLIGYDANDANTLIVVVGSQLTEMPEANCSPTGRGERPIGESYRREYLKRFPGNLKS